MTESNVLSELWHNASFVLLSTRQREHSPADASKRGSAEQERTCAASHLSAIVSGVSWQSLMESVTGGSKTACGSCSIFPPSKRKSSSRICGTLQSQLGKNQESAIQRHRPLCLVRKKFRSVFGIQSRSGCGLNQLFFYVKLKPYHCLKEHWI